jgi:hypothetical protein
MRFKLTSPFGALEEIRNGKPHTGIDLKMESGTELRSIADGVIERVVDYGSQNIGKGVVIKLEDGTRLIYGHMSDISVKVGEIVSTGKLIGLSGNSGHSTGPHLHFGVWKDGKHVDPVPYIEKLDSMSGVPHIPWWDVKQRVSLEIQETKAAMVAEFKEEIYSFLQATGEVLADISYGIVLFGGAILILLRVAGMTRATKYFWVMMFVNVLCLAMF